MENNNKNKVIIWAVVIVVILAGIVFYVLKPSKNVTENPQTPVGDFSSVVSFQDCTEAGYPVTQSLPRECRVPDGRILKEGVDDRTKAVARDGCFIGGCGNQLCSDQPGDVSSCVSRDEDICYQTAVCEKQESGQCGWTQSSDIQSCLQSAIQEK